MMRAVIALVAVFWVVATTQAALAHAFLTRASPAVGGTVRAMPAEVTLRFTENVEPDFCTVQVTAPGGERIDTGAVRVDAAEPAVLHVPLKAPSPGAAGAGAYKVAWRAVSVDTHVTHGDFSFTVAP
jgi:methionine-rich copper-binding protein CopC